MLTKHGGSNFDATKGEVSYVMWMNIITSIENGLFIPEKETLYQDMTQPLSHYFIASSHNTYLEGDQLMSNSSVQRYIDDLLSGCRCVELDCWDGDKGEPVIYHGHTLTSKIFFSDVIAAIKEYGFKTSAYPIILSIENHCSLPQQQRLAHIMKTVLGTQLAMPVTGAALLPSPEVLKNKVLVKGKRVGSPVEEDDEEEEAPEDDEPQTSSKKSKSKGKSKKEDKGEHKEHSTHPELSEITFLSTGKVKGFDESGNLSIPCDNMCSFSENTTLKYLKDPEKVSGWILHNARHLR